MNQKRSLVLSTQPQLLRTRLRALRSILVGSTTLTIAVTVPVAKGSTQKTPPKTQSKKTGSKPWPLWRKALDVVAVVAMVMAVAVGGVLLAPKLYYTLVPVESVPVQAKEEGSALGGEFAEGAIKPNSAQKQTYLPPKDETLPEGKWIIIPRIGVRTQLQETENPEEALTTGVWQVPGYGQAGDTDQPLILAAHRFGWEWWWQSDYWKYNSFYLLPDTEPGDIVEIIDGQRKWTYEIYGGGEGDDINDYNADMILYTCKFLNSPIRHFRYARLINPEANTQV
jgi:hypothetical protein